MAQAELVQKDVCCTSETNGRGVGNGTDSQMPYQNNPQIKSQYKRHRKRPGARSSVANRVHSEADDVSGLEQSYDQNAFPSATFESSKSESSRHNRRYNDNYYGYGNQFKMTYRGGRKNDNRERESGPCNVSRSYANTDSMLKNNTYQVESSNSLPYYDDLSESGQLVSSNAATNHSEQGDEQKKSNKLAHDNGVYQEAKYREGKSGRVDGRPSQKQQVADENGFYREAKNREGKSGPVNERASKKQQVTDENGFYREAKYHEGKSGAHKNGRSAKWALIKMGAHQNGRSSKKQQVANENGSVYAERGERSNNGCGNLGGAELEKREQVKGEAMASQHSSLEMLSSLGASGISHDSLKAKSESRNKSRSNTSANGFAQGHSRNTRNGRREISYSSQDNHSFRTRQQATDQSNDRSYELVDQRSHEHVDYRVVDIRHGQQRSKYGNIDEESRSEQLGKYHDVVTGSQRRFRSQNWKKGTHTSSDNEHLESAVVSLSLKDPCERSVMRESSKGWDVDAATVHYGQVKTSKKYAAHKKMNYPKSPIEDETQREMLIDQLTKNMYECMICCNVVRREAAIWNCSNCFHIFHLYCIKRWANSSSAVVTGGDIGQNCWRCPACQNPTSGLPNSYMCFCGKAKDPDFSQFSTPHGCGETCGRKRANYCPHNCTLQCHPGPCPACPLFVTRTCSCGKTKQTVKCSNVAVLRCDEPCGKTLNCGRHDCAALCHDGPCEPCNRTTSQTCHCGKESQNVLCGSQESFVKSYSCGNICSMLLVCKNHTCEKICHEGSCDECLLQPALVTHCPCGKKTLVEITGTKTRTSCTDEVQTCGLVCQKPLLCGPEDVRHICSRPCHTGQCGPCGGMTDVTCRCGSSLTQMPCKELAAVLKKDEAGYRCDRRCNKKMSCGRHKCGQLCCFNSDHICRLICGYKLSCGEHKCEEPCHRGNCPSCWRVSFDELRCHCGTEVIYPPVPCGTPAPTCNRPCTRTMPCGHEVNHPCHSDPVCPPCAVLSQKWCHGRHELRCNIPCYVADVSCGKPCNKSMPCQVHKCAQTCHKGACPPCRQPCPAPRPVCGHPCSSPCHIGSPCPSLACKTEILVRCECGRREERVVCMQGASGESRDAEYNKMAAQSVAARLWEGQSIDIGVLKKELKNRKLVCTSECSIMERNQRIALALEIKNPDISGKLGNPSFSVFLKEQAKLNPSLVSNVEKALTDIVLATQQSKVGKKSHSFKSMPSVQRRLIHELAEFYGCQTESYDEEPNKNVVATAVKDKCWLPNVTLTSLVQRELFPKAPMPIPINHKESDLKSAAKAAKQSTHVYSEAKTSSSASTSKRAGGHTYVDYFDMTD